MRKLVTLLAATTLMASPFVFANTPTQSNPNDVLQQIPAHQAHGAANTNDAITVADAGNAGQPAAMSNDAAKPAMKHHGKKHHGKKHHGKKRHHKHKAKKTAAAAQDTTDNTAGPAPMETPAS